MSTHIPSTDPQANLLPWKERSHFASQASQASQQLPPPHQDPKQIHYQQHLHSRQPPQGQPPQGQHEPNPKLDSERTDRTERGREEKKPVYSQETTDFKSVMPRSRYKTYILSDAVFEVEQRFEIQEIVGHGAYGVVCSSRDLKTGKLVAVKKVENIFEHRSLAKRTLRELKLTRYFYHENILGVERVMRPHSKNFHDIYLVSELMETDLACVIRSPQELTDEHCQFFLYQVLRGLKYIHSANVVHRDLKPRNLLVNSNCDLKICDFGLARVDDPENADRCVMSNYIATRWYRAPEVILSRKRYTKAVDMWSVGCILAELIGRKPLFPGRDSFHQITLIISILGTPPPEETQGSTNKKSKDYVSSLPYKPKIPFTHLFPTANPLACDLLDKLLQFDPDKRYTVEQALAHPYLDQLHCEEDEPVCENFDLQDFYFEYLKTTKEDLRMLIYQEIVNNYKEETWEPKQEVMENFPSVMLKALPKSKRRRRKSF